MIPIVCVSDDLGMVFNNRRQSRDEELIKYLIKFTVGKAFRVGERSEALIEKFFDIYAEGVDDQMGSNDEQTGLPQMIVSPNYLEKAGEGEYCFVEFEDLKPYEDKIEKLMVCRWNRAYPSDKKLDIDLSEYHLASSKDIKGKSHEKITIEVWEKNYEKAI